MKSKRTEAVEIIFQLLANTSMLTYATLAVQFDFTVLPSVSRCAVAPTSAITCASIFTGRAFHTVIPLTHMSHIILQTVACETIVPINTPSSIETWIGVTLIYVYFTVSTCWRAHQMGSS